MFSKPVSRVGQQCLFHELLIRKHTYRSQVSHETSTHPGLLVKSLKSTSRPPGCNTFYGLLTLPHELLLGAEF